MSSTNVQHMHFFCTCCTVLFLLRFFLLSCCAFLLAASAKTMLYHHILASSTRGTHSDLATTCQVLLYGLGLAFTHLNLLARQLTHQGPLSAAAFMLDSQHTALHERDPLPIGAPSRTRTGTLYSEGF